MKTELIDLLQRLNDPQTHIVRELPLYKIKPGNMVFIDGQWLEFMSGRFERKLSHITVKWSDDLLGYYTYRGITFLVKDGKQ